MLPKPRSEVRCQPAPSLYSTGRMFHIGILCLLGTVLAAGCVSSEKLKAEKVRGLNFQRLLAQEEKRANTLNAQLAQKDKEIDKLNDQLKETKDKVAALELANRNLTGELNALQEHSRQPAEQAPAPDSSGRLTRDSGTSKDGAPSEPSLSDPFMSDEELLKILE